MITCSIYFNGLYKTPAHEIFTGLNSIINENIASISEQIKFYHDGGFLTTLYTLKDKVTRSELTKKRVNLAVDFSNELTAFKAGINPTITARQLQNKCIELNQIVSTYECRNNEISRSNNKSVSRSRLADNMGRFRVQLEQLRTSIPELERGKTKDLKSLY